MRRTRPHLAWPYAVRRFWVRLAAAGGLAMVCAPTAAAESPQVVLLREIVKTPTQWTTQTTVDGYIGKVRTRLADAGVPSDTLDDRRATAEVLSRYRMALLPYNPGIPDTLRQALGAFSRGGGRIGMFYASDAELLKLVGIDGVRYRGSGDLPKLSGMAIRQEVLPGAPSRLGQGSWNVNEPTLTASGEATVAATWMREDGSDTGIPALVLHPAGFFVGHVYLDESPAAGGHLLLSLVDRFLPGTWKQAVLRQLEEDPGYYRCGRLEDLSAAVADRPEAREALDAAAGLRQNALGQMDAGRPAEAMEAAGAFREALERAYLVSRRSARGELRGAWIHSGFGIDDWGWERTVKVLADHGFNAIFPNLCWGAVADYPSEVLPVHPRVAEKGDQLAQCLAACRRYGIELHVWRVNWNMGHHTPPEVRQRFVDAGRVQVDYHGKPSTFLAPHLEANQVLEREAMLEIVRKYPVDGIHFDYIRYPGDACDFSAGARAAFETWHGAPAQDWPADCRPGGALREAYNRWRRSHIDRLVQTVYEEAHALRPDVAVSAAVFGGWASARDTIAQDAAAWVRNGWLDFLCPMNYTRSDSELLQLITSQVRTVQGRIPIYCGLGAWQHPSAAVTAGQIDLARWAGSDGFVCFALARGFAERDLPRLALGSTREPAGELLPHHARRRPRFDLSEGDPDLEGNYALNEWVTVTAAFDRPCRALTPEVVVLRDGFPCDVKRSLSVSQWRRRVRCRFFPDQPGMYRVEIGGTLRAGADAEPQALLARSLPVRVLSDDEMAAARLRTAPPAFAGRRGALRVAVWQDDAYGAAPILEALRREDGVDAAPLLNLRPESLARCRVLVLPQPRLRTAWFRDAERMRAIREFAAAGGGVLVTHALVGIRGYIPVDPRVAEGGTRIPGSSWQVCGGHPVADGLPAEVQESTYADRIGVEVGPNGRAVLQSPDGAVLAAAGASGRGRYLACGLGLGIGPGDEDVPLTELERAFLVRAARWLGGKTP